LVARRGQWRNNPEWQWVVRNLGSVTTTVVGLFMVVAAIWVVPDREALAGSLVGFGAALVAMGAVLPRLIEGEVGAHGGRFKLAERAVEASLQAAATEVRVVSHQDPTEVIGAARYLAASAAVADLLEPDPDGPLAGAGLALFLYDADQDLLLPAFSEDADLEGWRPGQGATGTAWSTGQFVVVEGAAVSDDTYGLTAEQQARYKDLLAVAAMPILNATGAALGVLAAAVKPGGPDLSAQDPREELEASALQLARVLVDLLRWFPDGYDDDDR
jgi:hypothetical protein